MADWVDPPYTQLVKGKPWTEDKATAAFENVVALAEGAPGAPRVEPIAFASGYYTAGAIGTYVFANSTTTSDVAFGSTRAGSELRPTSALYGAELNATLDFWFGVGSALSGTWRAMGYYDYQVQSSSGGSEPKVNRYYGATLWLRIS